MEKGFQSERNFESNYLKVEETKRDRERERERESAVSEGTLFT